ncbi:MAG: type II secretion system protein [Magnetococcales bacterium]|nr:type II secretion system protein [Magnetococcales bacterium]
MKTAHVSQRSRVGIQRFMAGFSLIELSVSIVVIGVITGVALSMSTGRNAMEQVAHRSVAKQTMATISSAEDVILGYAMRHERLPCPDTDDDGDEDCDGSAALGTVPYLDIGLSQPFRDGAGNPVVYGVYRNPDVDADLTVISDRMSPWLLSATRDSEPNTSGEIADHVGYENRMDFCRGLFNAMRAKSSGSYTHDPSDYIHIKRDTSYLNQAYVLASGGMMDADGDGSHFDGENANTPALQFETPDRRKSDTSTDGNGQIVGGYDDIVRVMPFGVLAYKQGCYEANMAMKALAMSTVAADDKYIASVNSYYNAVHGVNVATYDRDTAIYGTVMTAIDVAVIVFDASLTIAGMVKGSTVVAADLPGLAMAAYNAGMAIYGAADGLKGAIDGLSDAEEGLEGAIETEDEAWGSLEGIWEEAAQMDKDQGIKR